MAEWMHHKRVRDEWTLRDSLGYFDPLAYLRSLDLSDIQAARDVMELSQRSIRASQEQ